MNSELIRKHYKILEAKVTVKAHTSHSKKGRIFNVKQYDREQQAAAKTAASTFFDPNKERGAYRASVDYLLGKINKASLFYRGDSENLDDYIVGEMKALYNDELKNPFSKSFVGKSK